jgi:hypothetical protein
MQTTNYDLDFPCIGLIDSTSRVAGGGLATPLLRARLWCY